MNIITIKELSAIIKVKEKTLYQWAELEQIPCIKINGSLRFDFDDVLKWINRYKKGYDSSYNSKTQARSPRKESD